MKKLTLFTLATFLVAITSLPAFAASSAWNGTWKLDQARSHMTGSTVTITKTGPETYRFSNGVLSETMTCDGKVHPTLAGYSGTCLMMPGGSYEMTTLRNGILLGKTHETLSNHGKTDTRETTDFLPNGKTATSRNVSVRLSGGPGLAGTWKNIETHTSSPDLEVYSLSGDTLHISVPNYKEHFDAKLDGTPASLMGPRAPEGFTISLKKVGPREIHEVDRLNGKVVSVGNDTISANGKTQTYVSWTPGKASQKETDVYIKQ